MGGARTTISCAPLVAILILFEGHAAVQLGGGAAASPPASFAARWRAPLPSGPSAPPVADAGLVFIPLRVKRLMALATTSGLERWSVDLETKHRPAVGAGMLFVATSSEVRAFEAESGALKWRLASGPVAAAPVWCAGWLFVGTEDGELMALRAADGSLVWRRQFGRLSADPAVDGERIIVPLEEGRVALADLATGEERWSRPLGSAPGRILPDDNRVFVGARDNFFYSLDARSGAISWRWRTAGDVIGLPAVDTDRVYFVSFDNVLRALDRSHGAQRWRRELPMRALDGPRLVDGRLAVSGLSAEVLLFNGRDGSPAGRWTAPAELGAPITPVDPGASGVGVVMVAVAGAISGEWMAVGVGGVQEPPVLPLSVLPGKPLPPEVVPGRRGS